MATSLCSGRARAHDNNKDGRGGCCISRAQGRQQPVVLPSNFHNGVHFITNGALAHFGDLSNFANYFRERRGVGGLHWRCRRHSLPRADPIGDLCEVSPFFRPLQLELELLLGEIWYTLLRGFAFGSTKCYSNIVPYYVHTIGLVAYGWRLRVRPNEHMCFGRPARGSRSSRPTCVFGNDFPTHTSLQRSRYYVCHKVSSYLQVGRQRKKSRGPTQPAFC